MTNIHHAFENGKAARFPISAYETKQNRKKLINAYFDGSRAVGFLLLDEAEDPDLIVTNNLDKAAVFKASLIPLKTTRTTQGVQLLVSKKGSVLKSVARLAEVEVQDPEYYRIRKLPAIGYYIREKSLEAFHLENFLAAIRGEEKLNAPADKVYASMVAAFGALRSAARRETVYFKPTDFTP